MTDRGNNYFYFFTASEIRKYSEEIASLKYLIINLLLIKYIWKTKIYVHNSEVIEIDKYYNNLFAACEFKYYSEFLSHFPWTDPMSSQSIFAITLNFLMKFWNILKLIFVIRSRENVSTNDTKLEHRVHPKHLSALIRYNCSHLIIHHYSELYWGCDVFVTSQFIKFN